jgi:CheY-like chemotaxis protein
MKDRLAKILVVDDSKTFITHVTHLLRKMGFTKVIIAEDGVEALKIMNIWSPDTVLLDIEMPHMDGITALRHIREIRNAPDLPVIMLTSDEKKETHDECIRLGCSGYLVKPVDIATLHDAMQECVVIKGSSRRVNIRTRYEKKVGITHNGETEVLDSTTLSEGGIYVIKQDSPPVGTELGIILPVSDKKPLHLKGRVIYHMGLNSGTPSMPPGMALEFKDLTEEVSELLRTYITELITGRGSRPESAPGA